MNKQQVEKINEYLMEVLEAAKQGAEIAAKNVPTVIEQFLTYKTWNHSIALLLILILCFVTVIASRKCYRNSIKGAEEWIIPAILIPAFAVLPLSFGFYSNLQDLLHITISPITYMIEYFR